MGSPRAVSHVVTAPQTVKVSNSGSPSLVGARDDTARLKTALCTQNLEKIYNVNLSRVPLAGNGKIDWGSWIVATADTCT